MDLLIIFGICCALIMGFNVFVKYQQNKFHALVKKVFLDLTPVLYTELDKNTLYLYDKKTNQFQCQADNIENLAKQYWDVRDNTVAKVLHDNKELWFVKGDVLDEIEILTEEVK